MLDEGGADPAGYDAVVGYAGFEGGGVGEGEGAVEFHAGLGQGRCCEGEEYWGGLHDDEFMRL